MRADVVNAASGRKEIKVNFDKAAPADQTYKWKMCNIKNPPSTVPSDLFADILIVDIGGYAVMSYDNPADPNNLRITNTKAANIIVANLAQDTTMSLANAVYTITFRPINVIPATGSIQIVWPT